LLAEILELQLQLLARGNANRLRYADPAGRREGLEPGRDVDAVPVDVAAILDHVAEVDSDPKLDLAIGRNPLIAQAELALHVDGTRHRVAGRFELREDGVARVVHHTAAMAFHRRRERIELAAELSMSADLVVGRQAAIACNIRIEHGGKLMREHFGHRVKTDRRRENTSTAARPRSTPREAISLRRATLSSADLRAAP
jgi:hypothetical protein